MKMSTTASKALEESIVHWERVVADPLKIPIGGAHCALCQEFALEYSCYECPIMIHTGKSDCMGTPYGKFNFDKGVALHYGQLPPDEQTLADLCCSADKELQFLISLRED